MTRQISLFDNDGFTLIELLVSLVIVMVGMMALLASVNLALVTNVGNEMRQQAVSIGEDTLNNARAMAFANITGNWTQVTSRSLRRAQVNYSVTKSITNFTNTKQITVGVSWVYKKQPVQHTVSTMVGNTIGSN